MSITKEKAKDKLDILFCGDETISNEWGKLHGLIEDICDGYESKLRQQQHEIRNECQVILSEERLEYESRICSNCKHYIQKTISDFGKCDLDVVDSDGYLSPLFGCNKFERMTEPEATDCKACQRILENK